MHGVGKLFILTRAAHFPFVLRDRTKYGTILRKWHAPFARGILTGWRVNEDVIDAVVQYENLNREVSGDEPDLTDILATSYLVVGHAGRMHDLSMTVEKIASFSRLRLNLMAVEETLEQAKEEIEDLRLVDQVSPCHTGRFYSQAVCVLRANPKLKRLRVSGSEA